MVSQIEQATVEKLQTCTEARPVVNVWRLSEWADK